MALSALAGVGQFVTRPSRLSRSRFTRNRSLPDPSYWVGVHAGAPFATLTVGTMLIAGVLLILGIDAWAYFGLVGGGMSVYLAGRAVFNRIAAREGVPVGAPHQHHRIAYTLPIAWGVVGLITIAAAFVSLQGG